MCAVALVACKEGQLTTTNVPIETAKAGKIKLSVYPQNDKMVLTPLANVVKQSVTDDGKGIYTVTIHAEGEGTATMSEYRVHEGERVAVTTTPAEYWRFDRMIVDGETILGDSFLMPSHSVEVGVYFVDTRHQLGCNSAWAIIAPQGLLEDGRIVEGQRYYFNVSMSDEWHYFLDHDVHCRSYYYDNGEYTFDEIDVRKEGEGRYSFEAPARDCELYVDTHDYYVIQDISVCIRSGDGAYDAVENRDAYCAVTMTVDDSPFGSNEKCRQDAYVNIDLTPVAGWQVDKVEGYYPYKYDQATRFTDTHYVLKMEKSYQWLFVCLSPVEIPEDAHTITCSAAQNGAISAGKDYATPNELVTVTVTPDEGYALATLQYSLDGEWYDIALSDMGEYEFFMPEGDVTIQATFRDSSQPPASGLRVYVQTPEYGEELVLTEVISYIVLMADDEVIPNIQIADDMTLPVEAGQWSLLEVGLKEGYELLGIYYHNDSVMVSNYGRYGAAEFEVGEDDPDGGAIIVVVA